MMDEIEKIIKMIGKQFGMIHKSAPCVYNGEKGFLIWDYILYNELTFVNERTKEYQSLFTSWSDSKTQAEFNRLIRLSDNYIQKEKQSNSNKGNDEAIDAMQQIKKLKELLDMGAISETEFETKKKKLLERI